MNAVKSSIQSDHERFIDTFVAFDGITKIITILRHPKNQLVSVALDVIQMLLGHESALLYMKQKPDLFTNLYEKMDSPNSRLRFQTHNIFVWLCRTLSTGSFHIIMNAATNYAKRNNKSPFGEIINSLNKKWDTELRYVTLLLINCIIVKSPSEKKLSKFLARLENLGIYDELRSLSQEKDERVIKQLQNFQISTRQIFPGMQFEVEVHKNRIKTLENHNIVLEKKIMHYIEQQSMFHLMRNDLEKYKKVYELSKELETIYSPFTPHNQYSETTLRDLPKKHDIIDLTKIMEDATHEFDRLKNRVHLLEKENRSLKGFQQKADNTADA